MSKYFLVELAPELSEREEREAARGILAVDGISSVHRLMSDDEYLALITGRG